MNDSDRAIPYLQAAIPYLQAWAIFQRYNLDGERVFEMWKN